jgi:hypothetical protein
VIGVATYIVFYDLDGSYWVLKVLQRINRIGAEEIVGVVGYCVPRVMCSNLIGKVVSVLAVDLDYYIYMYIPFKSSEVLVVSGGLGAKHGYLIYQKGLKPQEISERLSGGKQELFFRDLYYTTLSSIAEYEKSCSDTIKQIMESYREAINASKQVAQNVTKYTAETLGFIARPEAMVAAESALTIARELATRAAAPVAPVAPAAPAPAPSPAKPLFERLKGLLKGLLWFRKPKAKVISPE